MGIRAVPKQGTCNKCREYLLRPDVFVERDVNICGLCLSQPRTRSVLEVWEGAVVEGDKGGLDAASPNARDVNMRLARGYA